MWYIVEAQRTNLVRCAQPQYKAREEENLAVLKQKVIIDFHDPGPILRWLKASALLLVVVNVAQAVSFQMWLGKPLLSYTENSSQR